MAELPAGRKMLRFYFYFFGGASDFVKINTLQALTSLPSLTGNRLHVALYGIVMESGGWECNEGHTDSIVGWSFGWVCACVGLTSEKQSVPVTKMEKASLVRVEFGFYNVTFWLCHMSVETLGF